jgi:hypothetical protein
MTEYCGFWIPVHWSTSEFYGFRQRGVAGTRTRINNSGKDVWGCWTPQEAGLCRRYTVADRNSEEFCEALPVGHWASARSAQRKTYVEKFAEETKSLRTLWNSARRALNWCIEYTERGQNCWMFCERILYQGHWDNVQVGTGEENSLSSMFWRKIPPRDLHAVVEHSERLRRRSLE